MRIRTITIILILVYFIGTATLYNRSVPIFEASDEAEHFLYIHSILTHHELPVINARENVGLEATPTEIWNNHVHHAPLYYLLGAGVISWSERTDIDVYLQPNDIIFVRGLTDNNPNKWLHSPYASDGDTAQAVYLLRIMNTLLGALTLCMVYASARLAWGRDVIALGTMAFVASIPSFIVVHSSVTNDALVIFFYGAGTLWLMNVWRKSTLTTRDSLLISLIVVGASLSKLTGASLAGVVALALLGGVWRGRFPFGAVLKTGVMIALAVLLLAGWWYVRNYQLYGDLFALSATESLWGREFDLPDAYNSGLLTELDRIGRSFWLMVGYRHAPLMADDRLFGYGMLVILLGMIGVLRGMATRSREIVAILMMICLVAVVMLLIGTRNVDISYGRILFPALPALALMVVFGWFQLFGRWGVGLLIAPLIVMSAFVPRQIERQYPTLRLLTPATQPLQGLVIEQAHINQATIYEGDTLRFQLTFAGMLDENPYLLATVVDPITGERLGHAEVYVGHAPTRALKPDGRYQTWVSVPMDAGQDDLSPRMVDVYLRWSNQSEALRFDGAVWFDRDYQAPDWEIPRPITFGDIIQLAGYTIERDGRSVALDLWWKPLNPIEEDWVLTVQLLNHAGELITQTDGLPLAYPPSRWVDGVMFVDRRVLTWNMDLPTDHYDVMLAWYRLEGGERLPITSETAINQIILLETIYLTP